MRQVSGSGVPCGALAQLGERLICIQEVIGSIPIGSTKTSAMLRLWFRLSPFGADDPARAGSRGSTGVLWAEPKTHEEDRVGSSGG